MSRTLYDKLWDEHVVHTEDDGTTLLRAVCTYDSAETVAMVVGSGMEHGLQSSYDAIDDMLVRLQHA